jgi:hypothetical protein
MIALAMSSAAFLAAAPSPAFAQQAKTAQVAAAPASKPAPKAEAPIDPARFALAEKTAALLMPDGVYEKVMAQTFSTMMPDMMTGIFGSMKPSDIVPVEAGSEAALDPNMNKTMSEIMAEEDPHFNERMAITMRIMGEKMAPVMRSLEPKLRTAMAKSFARKFSAKELGDMNVFFASPAGKAYAENYLLLMSDAEYVKATMEIIPEILPLVMGMEDDIKKATAHLPEPKNSGATGTLLNDVAMDVTKLPPCGIDGDYADCKGADRDKLVAAYKAEGYDLATLEKAQADYDAAQKAEEAKYAAEEAARTAKAAALRAAWSAKDRTAVEKLEKQMEVQQGKADGEMAKVYTLEAALSDAKRLARKNAGQPEDEPEEAGAEAWGDAATDAAKAGADAAKAAGDAAKAAGDAAKAAGEAAEKAMKEEAKK